MGLPKPQVVANWIVESGNTLEFKKLEEVCYSILRTRIPTASEEEISDFVEQFLPDIANDLFSKENENKIDGVDLNFTIIQEDDIYYIKFFDKPEIQLLRKLQQDTPENFEIFCKHILDRLGGKSSVEGGPYDGGVDFISFDLKLSGLPEQSTKGSKILVIGQAKRYSDGNPVKEKELREFVGSCIKKVEEIKRQKSEQIGILHPVILAFWTTSDFHINAKTYAKELGIWYLNGVALTQLALKLKIEK